jgi:hypothetical protein
MAYYLIMGKVMCKYTKGECTLDTIAMAEFNENGAPLNWYKYLLTELFQACADAHDQAKYFIYCSLLVTFAMWKWKSSRGCSIAHNVDGPIAKIFEPWHFLPTSTNEVAHNVTFA